MAPPSVTLVATCSLFGTSLSGISGRGGLFCQPLGQGAVRVDLAVESEQPPGAVARRLAHALRRPGAL